MEAATAVRDRGSRVKFLIAIGVLGLFSAMLGTAAPEAQAHDPSVYHPSDGSPGFRTVVTIRSSFYGHHTRVDVCDRHADGNYAYARVWDADGHFYSYPQTRDQDGYGGSCNFGNVVAQAKHGGVIFYNVCVQNEGCGSTKYIGWARGW